MKIKIFTVLFVLLNLIFCNLLYSSIENENIEKKIDSLSKLIKVSDDNNKIDIYNELGTVYSNISTTKSNFYAHKAFKLARFEINKKGEAQSLKIIADNFIMEGFYFEALEYYQQSLMIFEENNFIEDALGIENNLAYTLYKLGNIKFAEEKLNENIVKSENIYIKINGQSRVLLGMVYRNRGDYEQALSEYKTALYLFNKVNYIKGIYSCYENIGNLFFIAGKYDKSLYYYNKALKLQLEHNDRHGISISFNNIGATFLELKYYKKSLFYFMRALDIKYRLNDKEGIASAYNNIGNVYERNKNYNKALIYFSKSLEISGKIKNKYLLCVNLYSIGNIHRLKNNLDLAENNLKHSLVISEEMKYKEIAKSCLSRLSMLYETKNDYKQSLFFYKQYYEVKDSLEKNINNKKIAELQIKYENEKTKKELKELEATKKLTQRNFIIVIFILVLIIIAISHNRIRIKAKTNELLKLKNEELEKTNLLLNESKISLSISNKTKDKFFSIISHDLRSPINSILGLTALMINKYDKLPKEKLKEYITLINNAFYELHNLLENLLQWSKSQSLKIEFNPVNLNLLSNVNNTIKTLAILIDKKHIIINVNIDEDIDIKADENMLSTVLRNLISNAIKYSHNNGEILVEAIEKETDFEIMIIDNGVGISEENFDKIFKLDKNFTTYGTQNERGSGLGLNLCKEFVERHKGTIRVESKLNEGSKFIFTIPKIL